MEREVFQNKAERKKEKKCNKWQFEKLTERASKLVDDFTYFRRAILYTGCPKSSFLYFIGL